MRTGRATDRIPQIETQIILMDELIRMIIVEMKDESAFRLNSISDLLTISKMQKGRSICSETDEYEFTLHRSTCAMRQYRTET